METGKEVWRYTTQTHAHGSLAVHEGVIYLTPAWLGRMLALDALTGTKLWEAGPVSRQPRSGGVVVGNGVAFSGGKPGVLKGIDIETQQIVFSYPDHKGGYYIQGAPVIADSVIYFADWGENYYAVDISTGALKWKVTVDRERFARGSLVADGRIYYGGDKGSLYAFGDNGQPPNLKPIVSISASSTTGQAPLEIHFTSSAQDPDGTIASHSWNFGDGGTSSTPNPTYTYNTAGTYTVTLTVVDNLVQRGRSL